MDQKELEYLRRIEDHAAQTGWVAPLTQEDKEYFAYLRQVSKRYNINLSKANRLEYDFVTRVAESEFYLQRANIRAESKYMTKSASIFACAFLMPN